MATTKTATKTTAKATTKKKASTEKITLVPLTDLYERAYHPIKMRDDDSMQETVESVKQQGVLTPGIVRPRAEGGYEIIAGRRRKIACELAGTISRSKGRPSANISPRTTRPARSRIPFISCWSNGPSTSRKKPHKT